MPRPLFIAATRQHVGKTTVSLAVMSGLKKRFGKPGFMKPVGQQHIPIHSETGEVVRVDKDVQLMREYFNLNHLEYPEMSPVLVPKDYTKDFINGAITSEQQVCEREMRANTHTHTCACVHRATHGHAPSLTRATPARADRVHPRRLQQGVVRLRHRRHGGDGPRGRGLDHRFIQRQGGTLTLPPSTTPHPSILPHPSTLPHLSTLLSLIGGVAGRRRLLARGQRRHR